MGKESKLKKLKGLTGWSDSMIENVAKRWPADYIDKQRIGMR